MWKEEWIFAVSLGVSKRDGIEEPVVLDAFCLAKNSL